MVDSATRLRDHRMHLFDPVGLINDDAYSIGVRRATTATSPDDGSSPLMLPMSPNSRTEAIARGRRELMEMIKDLPESFYELSLRDIVDQESTTTPVVADDEKKVAPMADPKKKKKAVVVSKKIARSRSADNVGGYLLKTSVFPISFGMRRRRKRSLISTGSLKAGATSAAKNAEKDWWRRKQSESDVSGGLSSSSDSGGSSGSSSRSSSSSSRRHRQSNRFLPGCCSFKANK